MQILILVIRDKAQESPMLNKLLDTHAAGTGTIYCTVKSSTGPEMGKADKWKIGLSEEHRVGSKGCS